MSHEIIRAVKLATWNVNSLKVRLPQVLQWLSAHHPDVLCLQETKLADEFFPVMEIEAVGYRCVFSGQKTYNGVAILSREAATDVQVNIPGHDDAQKRVLVNKIVARLGSDLSGRTIALWGLAFKPNTDDMREAPSRVIVAELVRRGARIVAYDPIAMDEARRVFADVPQVAFAKSPLAACDGADALVVITEWQEFRSPDFEDIRRRLATPLVFDGRNLYPPAEVRAAGLEYFGIGRK